MSIIISKNGQNAVRVEKTPFDKEDHLQQYIYENPESIPLYEIKDDIKLLILAREFPTNSGPIDALGIDEDGSVYVIETKLYNNADKRRVVAQALDYGASLWKHVYNFEDFVRTLDAFTQKKFNLSSHDKIQEYFDLDEDETNELVSKIARNISDGTIKFVILMDELDGRLRDLILYVNQNSKFDIYAVEFEYYKHDAQEIIIPRLYGAEVKKDVQTSSSSSSARYKWNDVNLLTHAKDQLKNEEYSAFEKLYSFAKEHADKVNYGTGAYGSFSPVFEKLSEKSILSISTSPNYSFGLNFEWVAKNGREDSAILLRDEFVKLGFEFDPDFLHQRPSIPMDKWVEKVDDIISVLQKITT